MQSCGSQHPALFLGLFLPASEADSGKASVFPILRGGLRNHREMYKNGQNRHWKLGHLQKGRTEILLVKPKSVSISTFGVQNKTGWVLFVNSRNQRKFFASEVTHSRVKVNYKQVWKRWGYWGVEKDLIQVISSLRCCKVGNLVSGAARTPGGELNNLGITNLNQTQESSLMYPLVVLPWRQTYFYYLPCLAQLLTQAFGKCTLNEQSPVHCKVWFTSSVKNIWLFYGEIQTVANIDMPD